MATIKRSELNALQAKAKQAEQFDSEASMWCRTAVQFMNNKNDLKDKLWVAEQEISDLKHALEREQNENDRVTDGWEALVAEQKAIIETQHIDIQTLTTWVIDLTAVQIDPPSCLKPKDALNWNASQAYAPNSGPY